MSSRYRQYSPYEISSIFAKLDPQDVEGFYKSYQLWSLQQQIAKLQTQVTILHRQIAQNDANVQQVTPSPISLAALAQLQSHDVNDIDLLDRMLERGEAWLDQMLQRLAYCEQFDFIRGNYTEWCEHALDGAYDWIDSIHEGSTSSLPEDSTSLDTGSAGTNDTLGEATEEILLQKLMSEEDEALTLETTLKRPSVFSVQPEETAPPLESEPETNSDSLPASAEQGATFEQSEVAPREGEAHTEHSPVEALQLEEEQPVQAEPGEMTGEAQELDTQSTASTVFTQEELIHSEFSDIPDASHVPIVQAIEVEQTEVAESTLSAPVNRSSEQTSGQVSAQPGNEKISQVTKPRQSRSFLQQLFALFFRR